jgi:hypothetical protein
MNTNSGKEMAPFIRYLGAITVDDRGSGPASPSGDRC